eukprot:1336658-Lingulodinium_polyedra.AAC.1
MHCRFNAINAISAIDAINVIIAQSIRAKQYMQPVQYRCKLVQQHSTYVAKPAHTARIARSMQT